MERVGHGGGGGGEGEEGGILTGVYGVLAGDHGVLVGEDREGGFQIEEKQKKQRVWNGLKMINREICG